MKTCVNLSGSPMALISMAAVRSSEVWKITRPAMSACRAYGQGGMSLYSSVGWERSWTIQFHTCCTSLVCFEVARRAVRPEEGELSSAFFSWSIRNGSLSFFTFPLFPFCLTTGASHECLYPFLLKCVESYSFLVG